MLSQRSLHKTVGFKTSSADFVNSLYSNARKNFYEEKFSQDGNAKTISSLWLKLRHRKTRRILPWRRTLTNGSDVKNVFPRSFCSAGHIIDEFVKRFHPKVLDMPEDCQREDKSLWIFGYGSLTWKVDFPYRQKVAGHVRGYKRRFYQGSSDHRGTPSAPGRVVTLLEDSEEIVWGLAYEVAPQDVEPVMEYLDYREKNGYKTMTINFYPKDTFTEAFPVMVYIATPLNEFYLGPTSLSEIAKQIVSSEGPSGKNSDYLFNLATAVRELDPECSDQHLFELEAMAKNLMEK